MSMYENLKLSELRDIVKSRGLGLGTQLRKVEMISFIKENDKIDQTQCKELIEKQRMEIERKYREEYKRNKHEESERREREELERMSRVWETIRREREREERWKRDDEDRQRELLKGYLK